MEFSILRDEVLLINQRGETKTVKEIHDILNEDDSDDKDEVLNQKWYRAKKKDFIFMLNL